MIILNHSIMRFHVHITSELEICMKEPWLMRNNRVIIISSIEFVLIITLFVCRYLFVMSERPVLLSLCDGFCMAGCIYIILSIIVLAVAKGALDGFFYICHIIANMFAKEKAMQGKPRYISYFDFLATVQHKNRHPKIFAIVGTISFLISLVILLLYNAL